MKAYYIFLKNNLSGVSFGFLLTLISSFGQTFLISLYVPDITASFSISNGYFGAIYSICTIISSAILLSVGHMIDHLPVKKVTLYSLFGLSASAILLGLSGNIVTLMIAIIGLRLTGQGLMSHISLTVMSRSYTHDRGKALSLSSTGYSAGEAILPGIVAFLIIFLGWNLTSVIIGAAIIAVFIPLLLRFNLELFDDYPQKSENNKGISLMDYFNIMKGRAFWRIAPSTFFIGFSVTALFFYQIVIAKINNWPMSLYAVCFTFYAISRLLFSLIGGKWVDKWGASAIFSIYAFPIFGGILAILIPGITGAFIFLVLTGVSVGLSGPVKSAIIAVEYGTSNLGAIRSLFTVIMVISTALGPLYLGYMMDKAISMPILIISLAVPLGISAIIAAYNKQKS